MSKFERFKNFLKGHRLPTEESLSLRAIITLQATFNIFITGIELEWRVAYLLGSLLLMLLSGYYGYVTRQTSSLARYFLLAAGMCFALFYFFTGMMKDVFDTRVPLAQLLAHLLLLQGWDSPRLINLFNLVLGSFALLTVTSTITYSDHFIYVMGLNAFFLILILRLLESSKNRQYQPQSDRYQQRYQWPQAQTILKEGTALICLSLAFFFLLPKPTNMRRSTLFLRWNLPHKVQKQDLSDASQNRGEGENYTRLFSLEDDYDGFGDSVDLNARGKLGDKLLFQVRSNSWSYYRGQTFDYYNGSGWSQSPKPLHEARARSNDNKILLNTPWRTGNNKFVQTIFVQRDMSNLLFASQVPREIYLPFNHININDHHQLLAPGFMEEGSVYTVTGNQPLTYRALKAFPDKGLKKVLLPTLLKDQYLQLPFRIDPQVIQVAKGLKKEDAWLTAMSIQSYLQNNYTYNLEAPTIPVGQDGASFFLLESKEGYCEHFATAMVVLCRSLGIPSRYVTGFTPGEYRPFSGVYEVRQNMAHAWVEIYHPQAGWVAFDPTPVGGQGALSERSQQHQSSWFPEMQYLRKQIAKAWSSVQSYLQQHPPWLRFLLQFFGLGLVLGALLIGAKSLFDTLKRRGRSSLLLKKLKQLEEKLIKEDQPARKQHESYTSYLMKIAKKESLPQLKELATHLDRYFYASQSPNEKSQRRQKLLKLIQTLNLND